MRRGEVWWADLGPPAGRRPVVLLSRESVYGTRTRITVAPATRTVRSIPSYVRLGVEDGMPAECALDLDDILTVQKPRLIRQLTLLSPDKMADVDRAIVFALGVKA